MPLGRLRALWLLMGPGLLLAATSIGASHLVLSPRAGLLFGPVLLWVVAAAHLFKYPAFDFGPRYALATGESLLAGYARVPGPRHWALWLFAFFTAAQGIGVAVAVTSITASVLRVTLGTFSLSTWAIGVVTTCVLMLVVGRFALLEGVNKVMMATLAVITLVTFCARPPAPDAFVHLVVPALPEGSLLLAAALVGWLPTGIDVSVWHSLWALEVRRRWSGHHKGAPPSRGTVMRRGLLDMRTGYLLSVVLAVCFLLVGTHIPQATAARPDGAHVAVAISHAYGQALGAWIMPAILLAAFFAMFSTTYVVLDGFPRAMAEALRLITGRREERWRAPYFILLGVTWAAVCLILGLWPRPLMLTSLAAVLSLAISPVYFALNHYCVTRLVPDRGLRPGRLLRGLSWVGILFVSSATALCLASQLGLLS